MYKVKQMHTLCVTLFKTISCTFISLQNANRPSFSSGAKIKTQTRSNVLRINEHYWRKTMEHTMLSSCFGKKNIQITTKTSEYTSDACTHRECNVECEIVVGEKEENTHTHQLRFTAREIELQEHCHLCVKRLLTAFRRAHAKHQLWIHEYFCIVNFK